MLATAPHNNPYPVYGEQPAREKQELKGCGAGSTQAPLISIVIPTLNEAGTIVGTLGILQALRGRSIEIIVIDGGSADRTVELAGPLADRVKLARRGRAAQMNAGAKLARADILLFLHADTRLPAGFVDLVHGARNGNRVWGRFAVRIETRNPILWLVASMMNARSRWSGIATGDQAIFVRRPDFERLGGFPEIPLMEDIALSKVLKRVSRPICLSVAVTTSSRRWERHGIVRTIILMWYLRWAYYRGDNPARLAAKYGYDVRHE